MAHSTNSFTINVAPGSKEFMLLDKLATTDFKPDAQYNLEPANSDILVDAIDRNSKHYAYNLIIARVPSQCVIMADNRMNITYDDTAGHDAWRTEHDAEKARQHGENPVPPDTNNTAKTAHFEQPSEPKKLSLSEKLRTALATTSASNPWDAEIMAQEN